MKKYIIGIDEVGRGALAGPVVVAAALLRQDFGGQAAVPASLKWKVESRKLGTLKDSKKLSPKQREDWFEYFKSCPDISYAVAFVYPRQIEKRNISGAANLAALRAYRKLVTSPSFPRRGEGRFSISRIQKREPLPTSPWKGEGYSVQIFLDGGLFLGSRKTNPSTRFARSGRMTVRTVMRADENIPAVAIASIIAKVTRDRAMVRLAKRHPQYGFELHKGYGTLIHRRAIKKHGPCSTHRKSFLKKLDAGKRRI